MYYPRKLKPAQLGADLLIPFFAVPVALIVMTIWGLRAAWGLIGVLEFLVVIMHLNNYLRTRNSAFLWLTAVFLLVVVFAFRIAVFGMTDRDPEFKAFAIAIIFAFIIIAYIVFTKKIKWRTREILELAAMPVNETKNGFTERPLSLGKIDATEHEINSFTLFLSKNMIAMPYRENGKIVFSLSNSYWKQNGLKRGYEDESWISITKDGDLNVFISKNDYLLYQDTFSFDQLCSSLGRLFIEFFEMFRRGEGVRIIDRLNALKLNPLTE